MTNPNLNDILNNANEKAEELQDADLTDVAGGVTGESEDGCNQMGCGLMFAQEA